MAENSYLIRLLIAKLSGTLALVFQLQGMLILWAICQKCAVDRFVGFYVKRSATISDVHLNGFFLLIRSAAIVDSVMETGVAPKFLRMRIKSFSSPS